MICIYPTISITLHLNAVNTIAVDDSEGCSTAVGNWCLAVSSWQCASSCITSPAECFGKTSNHPGDSAPLQPRFGILKLLTFPKTKITFEREEISGCQWDSGKYNGPLMVIGRTVWGPKVPTLKGTKGHCPVYNVSCIFFNKCVYVSIFQIIYYLLDRIYIYRDKNTYIHCE